MGKTDIEIFEEAKENLKKGIIETEITEFNKDMSKEERDYYGTHYDEER